jgi:hypothetical protein
VTSEEIVLAFRLRLIKDRANSQERLSRLVLALGESQMRSSAAIARVALRNKRALSRDYAWHSNWFNPVAREE